MALESKVSAERSVRKGGRKMIADLLRQIYPEMSYVTAETIDLAVILIGIELITFSIGMFISDRYMEWFDKQLQKGEGDK